MIRVLLGARDSLFYGTVQRVCREFMENEFFENGSDKTKFINSALFISPYAAYTRVEGGEEFGVTAATRLLTLIREAIKEEEDYILWNA
jgi:hypothetical protein